MIGIQVVGYKNSGKTTFVCAILKLLKELNFRVASLKHHGHGGAPLGLENTDNHKHLEAGASIAAVEGDGIFQIAQSNCWDMEQMLEVYKLLKIDVVIIEGFKQHAFDKIVLLHDERDLPMLDQVKNIRAVIAPFELNTKDYPYPIFKNQSSAMRWIETNTMTFSKV